MSWTLWVTAGFDPSSLTSEQPGFKDEAELFLRYKVKFSLFLIQMFIVAR